MSTYKTKVDHVLVQNFLHKKYGQSIHSIMPVSDGESAQAYYFDSPNGQHLVLKVSDRDAYSFHKDQFAYEHFRSEKLPIPRTIEVGEIQNSLHYSLSERAAGKTLDKFSKEEINKLMPEIIECMEQIHSTLPAGEGFGKWDLNGKAEYSSWNDSLSADLYLDDQETKAADFYNEELATSLRKEILTLLPMMPEERKLIHWDFGHNNTLSDGIKITGVFDWANAAYGDTLVDVAWLDFWAEEQGFVSAIKKHRKTSGYDLKNYNERIICYKLIIGLSSLGFFARSRQRDAYNNTIQIISRISR
jgi:hygromycin-B 4-O-kinase